MRSEMSLWGIYHYQPNIFTGFLIPDNLDRDQFIHALLVECMDLEVLYPDPEFLRDAIRSWSYAMNHSWTQIKDALYKDYEIIENYDRQEDWTDKSTRTDNLTQTTNGGTTGGGTVTGSNSTTNTHSAKGYNSGAMVAGEKEQIDTTTSNTTSDSTTNNSTTVNTGTQGQDVTRKGRIHGNIGVTTSQQMIQAEIDLRVTNQLTYIIINQFKQRFLLLVY